MSYPVVIVVYFVSVRVRLDNSLDKDWIESNTSNNPMPKQRENEQKNTFQPSLEISDRAQVETH